MITASTNPEVTNTRLSAAQLANITIGWKNAIAPIHLAQELGLAPMTVLKQYLVLDGMVHETNHMIH